MSIVKKDSGLPALQMPQLPQIFNKLQPVETPELTFNKGLIAGWYHKKKLRNIAEASEQEAVIAENRLRVTKATSEAIFEAMTFGYKFQNQVLLYQHEEHRMAHEKNMRELAEQKEQAVVAQEVLKAKNLEIENKDATLTYKLKLKEIKKEYGDDPDIENWE